MFLQLENGMATRKGKDFKIPPTHRGTMTKFVRVLE